MTRRLLLALVVAGGVALGACETTYEFESTTVGEGDGTTREARSKTSSQFVRGVYADLLARAPARYNPVLVFGAGADQRATIPRDEERDLVNLLDGVGDPGPLRSLIVRGLLEDPAAQVPSKEAVADPAAYVRDRFRRYLGREPNPYELAAFVDAWRTDPAVGPRAVIRALLDSREYQSR